MLEIRFNLLNDYVDHFVLCESEQTFSGKWKPLYWAERDKDRFEKWESKVTHVVAPKKDFETPFDRAGYQKELLRVDILDTCKANDIIYYGDVDEVWKPQKKEGKLRQLAYSYYLNNRSSEDWQGTNVCKFKNLINLNTWRADHAIILEDGGWHWTNLGNLSFLLNKIESYDHQEVNIPWVKEGLQARMEANIDFLGRTHDWKGNEFKMWQSESDLPQYILDNREVWIEKSLWKS